MPAAVLWDMDGTLVDTEPSWIASEFELAERHGGTWSRQHALNIVGRDLLDAGRYSASRWASSSRLSGSSTNCSTASSRASRRTCRGGRARVRLLEGLRSAGTPCALVTMSYRRFVDPILAELDAAAFGAVVTGETLERGKPHPEPYLTAAAALGVSAGECLAIEDSSTGVTSAIAAGCTVLVIPNHVAVDPGPGRVFRNSLADLTVRDLFALFASDPTASSVGQRIQHDVGRERVAGR